MARRLPKPLVPLLVAVSAIGLATAAALPSFAGPVITPDRSADPTPSATSPAPTPIPTMTPPRPPGPKDSPMPGPKDCSGCAQPTKD